MEIAVVIRDFLADELEYAGGREGLTEDLQLIENGVLDSLGVFQMVSYLEDRFQVSIEDEELVVENFRTIGDIAQLVESKLEASKND